MRARTWLWGGGVALALLLGGCDFFSWMSAREGERCGDYCAQIVECELETEAACLDACADKVSGEEAPDAEDCVLEQDCATASRCIVCEQYCGKLDDCKVDTDDACASSCETLLAGGADVEPYQCVIDEVCDDIATCGI